MTTPRIPCEFFLIRYVPDVVKGEFTNIGVLLREVTDPETQKPQAGRTASPIPPRLRFTRDWTRVECMHPDADTDLLEGLEAEMLYRLQTETGNPADYPKHILTTLTDSLSNSIQISESRACLAENLSVELDLLMKLYVESLRSPIARRVENRRPGRTGIRAAMRSAFEKTGVWAHMRKNIPIAKYTRTGDPMKLDCSYRPNGVIRVFHAVSLESDAGGAKSLSLSAPLLRAGFERLESAELDLAAVVEPLRSLLPSSPAEEDTQNDFTGEAAELYHFGVATMEAAGIRVLTVNNLAAAAERARSELRL